MIQVGDIIEFESTYSSGVVKHYGYVENICDKTDKARIRWFNSDDTEYLGQHISTWSYGLMWRKAR
jgi:hypothetical protein